MPGRPPSRPSRSLELPTEVVTVQVEGLPPEVDEDFRRAMERHRRKALRYLAAGNPAKGFGELVRASRAGPMTPRLAAYLANMGPALGNVSGTTRLLESGADDVTERDRARVQMRLVRLLRRTQQEARARSLLRQVVDESPDYLPAQLLQSMLWKAMDWEGVDAALAAQGAAAEKAGRPGLAARCEVARGRLWAGPGQDASRAARAFERASERFHQAGDASRALGAALGRLDALEEGAGPREAVLSAAQAALVLAEQTGDQARTAALRKTPAPTPVRKRRSTNTQLMVDLLQRGEPLDADAYEALATLYARQNDNARADQMEEVAVALRGKSRAAQPPVPALFLTPADRAGLRHPHLRNAAGDFLDLVGNAICQVTYAPERRSLSPFRVTSGKGSPAIADALLVAVRVLGLPAPTLQISRAQPLPLLPDFRDGSPQVLIGQAATRKLWPAPALRFFSGRALLGQSPGLLALLLADREPLQRAFELLGAALVDSPRLSREARGMSHLIPAKGREPLRELHQLAMAHLNLPELKEAALHSANRAGLVVCGGLGPALAALREMGGSKTEQEELVRFAASTRYLELRTRRDTKAG